MQNRPKVNIQTVNNHQETIQIDKQKGTNRIEICNIRAETRTRHKWNALMSFKPVHCYFFLTQYKIVLGIFLRLVP